MKNAERIMIDVARVVRDYECGARALNCFEAVDQIRELVADNCEHCSFSSVDCREDHKLTCFEGYSNYLRGEA